MNPPRDRPKEHIRTRHSPSPLPSASGSAAIELSESAGLSAPAGRHVTLKVEAVCGNTRHTAYRYRGAKTGIGGTFMRSELPKGQGIYSKETRRAKAPAGATCE